MLTAVIVKTSSKELRASKNVEIVATWQLKTLKTSETVW